MTLTNSLVNTQSAPININLSNNDLKKLEILNKTMSANIETMNKRVDFLILKLIKLFLFLSIELWRSNQRTASNGWYRT
jgi:hypothetical protein